MHLTFCAIVVLGITETYSFKSPSKSLQKCCSVDEQFTLNNNNEFECTRLPIWSTKPDTETQDMSSEWQWFVDDLLQTPHNKTISFKTKPNCSSSSMDILYNGHKRHEFNLVVKDDEAFLELLRNDSLSDLSIVFPSSSFCVEVGPGRLLVALLCPCGSVQCVRKCCSTSQVYNETLNACQESEFVLEVFPESEETMGRIDYYLLTSRPLDCSKRNFYQVKYNDTSGPSFFLLKNGSLQMQNSFDSLIDWKNNSFYNAFGLHWNLARRPVAVDHSMMENVVENGWLFHTEDYCWDHTGDAKELIQVCYNGEIVVDVYQLFGVLFMTIAFALLIVTVVVLVLAHACYCKRAYRSDV